MSSSAGGAIDEEMQPVVAELRAATAALLDAARSIYVASKVADTVIDQALPVSQQLLLYVVSAHVALSSLYCQRRLANEPVPAKLALQIHRVQEYLRRLQDLGIDVSAAPAVASEAERSRAARRQLDSLGESAGARRQRDESGDAAAAAAFAAAGPRRLKVDEAALANVAARVAKQPTAATK